MRWMTCQTPSCRRCKAPRAAGAARYLPLAQPATWAARLHHRSLLLSTVTASPCRYEGRLGSSALTEVEGFVCQTYRKCCRDPILDLSPTDVSGDLESSSGSGSGISDDFTLTNRTCLQQHEGTGSDVAISMEDPSSEKFCPYVVGNEIRIAPPTGICNPLNLTFPLAACQKNFCLTGSEGYFDFLLNLVAFVRYYGKACCSIVGANVFIQSVLLINLWNMRQRFRGRRDGFDDKGFELPRDEKSAAASGTLGLAYHPAAADGTEGCLLRRHAVPQRPCDEARLGRVQGGGAAALTDAHQRGSPQAQLDGV